MRELHQTKWWTHSRAFLTNAYSYTEVNANRGRIRHRNKYLVRSNYHSPSGVLSCQSIEILLRCSSAEDNSSHKIYIYGGLFLQDGVESNEVFILILPVFHWVSVYPSAKDKSDIDSREVLRTSMPKSE